MYRWFWIDKRNRPKHGCINGTIKRWPSKIFQKDFIRHIGDEFYSYVWYRDIKYIDMLSMQYHNMFQTFCYDTPNENIYYSSILDNFSFSDIVDWEDKTQLHTFTHPKQKFHEIYADHIIKKLNHVCV
jgi:hypothetical protein